MRSRNIKHTCRYKTSGKKIHKKRRSCYRCKIWFSQWVQGTPSLWPFPTPACPSLYSPCQDGPEIINATQETKRLSTHTNWYTINWTKLCWFQFASLSWFLNICTNMVYNRSQEVVHGVVGSELQLWQVGRGCIHQPWWSVPLEHRT